MNSFSGMKEYFSTALRIYKWGAIVFLLAYTVYIIYDDYVLLTKVSSLADFGMALGLEVMYLSMYFLAFTFYYFIAAVVIIAGVILFNRLGDVP
jgi:hypothetical protein